MLGIYKNLPKAMYVLFFARIANSMGNFVFPFLTLFLTQKLGMSESQSGLFIFICTLSFIPGSIAGGYLCDKIGRKSVILAATALSAAGFIACGFMGETIYVAYLIIVANFFHSMAGPANQSLTMDITNMENRKAAFSMINLGHMALPLVPQLPAFSLKTICNGYS
ncbi:MAG: MFS transporter [Spirochaetia bacterium]